MLLQGDSGTGKEKAASGIHSQSSRARGPFIPFNASALSPGIVASELFGNLANYPSHGMPARKGLLGTADRGTLFLDEIGDCPRDVQVQLLRVMDAGEYQAVGDAAVRRVDVRFVGATNRDDSVFRPDFLARFLVRVRLPPLQERREDIPLLARHFLLQRAEEDADIKKRFVREVPGGRSEPRFSVRFIDELVRCPLPDNARGLQRLLIEAIEASPGDEVRWPAKADTASAAPSARANGAPSGKNGTPGDPSREDVLACLKEAEGKVAGAARRLGVERTALYRLLKEYGIDRESRE